MGRVNAECDGQRQSGERLCLRFVMRHGHPEGPKDRGQNSRKYADGERTARRAQFGRPKKPATSLRAFRIASTNDAYS